MVGAEVLIGGRVKTTHFTSSKKCFMILKESECTVQCVASQSEEYNVSVSMIKFSKHLSNQSYVDVIGVVSLPKEPLKRTTYQVEIQVRKVYCFFRSLSKLPLNAPRSEADIELAGRPVVCVHQDTRLNIESLTSTHRRIKPSFTYSAESKQELEY